MNINLGELFVKLGMDASGLKDGAGEASKALGDLDWTVKGVIKTIVGLASAAAGPAALIALTQHSLDTIDAQSKLAYRLQGTTAGIQALQYAGDIADVSIQALTKSITMLDTNLAKAARTGSGDAFDALKRLGLVAGDLLKLDVDERLAVIADRFKALGYTVAQQSDVLKLFGIRGNDMVLLFENGGATLRKAREEVMAFGIALSNVDALKVEQANESWKNAKLLIEGIGNQLSAALAPWIEYVGDEFAKAGREAGGFGDFIKIAVKEGFIAVGILIDAIKQVYKDVKDMYDDLVKYKDILTAIFDPLGASWKVVKAIAEEARKTLQAVVDESKPDPSTREYWAKLWDDINADAEKKAKISADKRNAIINAPPAKVDNLTTEERKALDERLDNLRKAIADESLALQIDADKQLKEAKFLSDKLGLNKAQQYALFGQIDKKYEDQRAELVQSTLEQSILKTDEVLGRDYKKKLKQLQEFEDSQTITKEKAEELRAKITEKYQLDALQAAAAQYSGLANIVDTSLGQINQLLGSRGGAAFEIMKALSIATATVKGYEAVVGAYAAGNNIGGPAVGAIFAAIAAAGVAAQIANIARTQPGGGAGNVTAATGTTAAGAGSAAATSGGNASPQGQTIYIRGLDPNHLYTGASIRALAEGLRDYQRDGGRLVIE